ncbi:MAG: hypothetical protein QW597_06900 [Thermoplasmataceae archaeon]
MVLRCTYWIPHGDELIDLPDKESRIMRQKISEATALDRSPVRVVISPHGIGLTKNIGIIMTEHLHGTYRIKKGLITARYSNDRKLAEIIVNSFPEFTEKVTFASSSGPVSVFPVDFGTIIPLKFFKRGDIVMIGQPRINRKEVLVRFGRQLFKSVSEYEKEVSVIFSADMAHTHTKDGPYGFSEDAAKYDEIVQGYFKNQTFSEAMDITDAMIVNAKPDSYWNLLILSGFLAESGERMKFENYYVEQHFGMLFAHT